MLTIGTADATLPESRRVFAMVDHAEGIGAPDGSDPRCPQRTGIMPDDVGPRPDGGSWAAARTLARRGLACCW